MKNLVTAMHIGAIDGRKRVARGRTAEEKRAFAKQMQDERENHWYYVRFMPQSNGTTIGSVAHVVVPKKAASGQTQRFDKATNSWVKLS